MAKVYGRSGAERVLLQKCPPGINCFNEIKPLLTNYENNLNQARKTFFEELPNTIKKEKENLLDLEKKRQVVEDYWNNRINTIRMSFEENKWKVWKYIDLFIKEHFSKPKEIRLADKNIVEQKEYINRFETDPEKIFEEKQSPLINTIKILNRIIKSPDYSGAYGELQVLDELKKLDDSYNIICDKRIVLRDYIRYKGNRNLRSAQMDFIVFGPTGIFIIEVKNWSLNHVNHDNGFSPHEQVDRAGLVLWLYLKQNSFFYKPRVTKLIVPVQNNISYNSYYKSVLIRDVPRLRKFIVENRSTLADREINKAASLLLH